MNAIDFVDFFAWDQYQISKFETLSKSIMNLHSTNMPYWFLRIRYTTISIKKYVYIDHEIVRGFHFEISHIFSEFSLFDSKNIYRQKIVLGFSSTWSSFYE